MKLTETVVAQFQVRPGRNEDFLWDDLKGFGVRAYASGAKSYIVDFRVGRRQRKMALGPATPGRLVDMRRKASELLLKAKLGEDAAETKKQAIAKRLSAKLGDLLEGYISERQLQLKPRALEGVVLHLRTHWAPLHNRAIDKIARTDIVAVMDRIAEERGKTAADRAKTSLSGFFAWALDRELVPANPCLSIRRRGANPSRDRVLSLDELADIWRVCPAGDYGRIVKLLMLTGSRRNEIANLQWDEIDGTRREIVLPAARTKNSLVHVIPISSKVEEILQEIHPIAGREFLFGEGASSGFQAWSRSKRALDERINAGRRARGEKPIPQWQLHDLRRSFVTHMAEQKLALPHIIEACVNHQSGHRDGVAGVYNRAQYSEEKREAFQAWSAFVSALVSQQASAAALP